MDDAPISKRDAFVLVCRLAGLYVLIWTFDVASYLPEHIYRFAHGAAQTSVMSVDGYLHNIYLLELIFAIVRVAVLGCVSVWLFAGGPELQRLLLPEREREK